MSKTKPQQLRIIGGQWRGRKLAIADVEGLRPTGDRIRETLFNWLMVDIVGACCVDLFAGSGALGLECLSRGAANVILLEKNPKVAKQLKQHCQTLNIPSHHIIESDTLTWLRSPSIPPESVDIIFLDPPFAADLWSQVISQLTDSRLLKDSALIYIETPRDQRLSTPAHWELQKKKQAGQVIYRLFCYRKPTNVCSATWKTIR